MTEDSPQLIFIPTVMILDVPRIEELDGCRLQSFFWMQRWLLPGRHADRAVRDLPGTCDRFSALSRNTAMGKDDSIIPPTIRHPCIRSRRKGKHHLYVEDFSISDKNKPSWTSNRLFAIIRNYHDKKRVALMILSERRNRFTCW